MSSAPPEFSGTILRPHDGEYDAARRIWNGLHDRRPAFIARCRNAEDVSLAVRYAASLGLGATVRGGGHNVAGAAVADGTPLIDLSPLPGVEVDAGARRAEVEGGCLLRDLDGATTPLGLACPSGVVSHTGVGGLALGGGYGWLARKWGLTCDHLLAAQVVLASGEIVEASPDRHPDLFWALRGGGGGFGVVTRFSLRLRPVAPMYYRKVAFDLDHAESALAGYRAFAPGQSEDLHVVGALKRNGPQDRLPHGKPGTPILELTALHTGDPGTGAAAVADLFGPLPGTASAERLISHSELQALGDHGEPHGHRYYTKSCYLEDLSDGTVSGLLTTASESPSALSSIDFEYLRGAIDRGGEAASAFPSRAAPYMCTFSAHWTAGEDDAPNIEWARTGLARTSRDHHGGVYLNYLQDAAPSSVSAAFGTKRHHRLSAIRSRYDPKGLFRSGAIPSRPISSQSREDQ